MPYRNRQPRAYSDEFKGMVLGEYAAGASKFAITRKHGITMSTLDKWIAYYEVKQGSVVSQLQLDEISALVIKYTQSNLRGMIATTALLEDMEWLRTQTAEGIALLLATVHDKTLHLLASMQTSAQEPIAPPARTLPPVIDIEDDDDEDTAAWQAEPEVVEPDDGDDEDDEDDGDDSVALEARVTDGFA